MNIIPTALPDVKIIEPKVFPDARGFFVERFNTVQFALHNLPTQFAQDNFSRSSKGVLRGLHAQENPEQGKLVSVISGVIWDVAVDIRPHSATFGEHVAVELDGKACRMLWIPPGFAHGFCVLSETADVGYKVTAPYNPKGEIGIAWNDKELNIAWPVHNPLLSEKDKQLMSLSEYRKRFSS